MVVLQVGLDDEHAVRLAERARELNVAPEDLARTLLAAQLARPATDVEVDPFGWFGSGESERAQSDHVDELLAEGFGRSRS